MFKNHAAENKIENKALPGQTAPGWGIVYPFQQGIGYF
jgi:hypothetical protein